MSLMIDIDVSALDETGIGKITAALVNRGPVHERMAVDVEGFVKTFGSQKSQTEHRTATNLGANPTGHLEKAYQGIEGESDVSAARLLVPRASRLRAAFGGYTAKPVNGKTYLTIPVAAAAYGRRAGEFDDLVALRVGPKKSLILARKDADGKLTTMYFLTTSVAIKEDASLLPFDEIGGEAADSAERFYDELITEALA